MTENSQEIPQKPFSYIRYISRPFKVKAMAATFFIVVAAIVSQSSAYFFKIIIDAVEQSNNTVALVAALLYPGVVFASQTLYRLGGHFMRDWILNGVKYSNDALSSHLLNQSHAYFSDRFVGSLISKVTNASNAVDTLIREIMWTHLSAAVTLLVTLGFLITIDIPATIIFIALIITLIIFNQLLAPRKALLSKQSAVTGTAFRGGLSDVISNVQAVRQYAQRDFEEEKIAELSKSFRDAQHTSWEFTERNLFYNGAILFFFTLGMFWFLVTGWVEGTVSTGELILVLSLYSQISGMLMFIGRAISTTARIVGELDEALSDVLTTPEIVDAQAAEKLIVGGGEIYFNEVNFSFDETSVFAKFNLKIKKGEKIGLVGQSGAGKTTLVSLLLRQHDLDNGQILIDGQNIAEVTQDSLRENIAVVPQEPLLFHRTIRENILYANPEASEAEMISAAEKAQAHEFIMALPKRYETLVGERGVKLSGGQKQRVAIARAVMKDAPILVLDEATSALDSESEVAIQKALEKLMEGKTVIAVAHRLSTLRKMDRIIVLEDGKIIEDGTHDELSTNGLVYQRLWEHQAGGFLTDEG